MHSDDIRRWLDAVPHEDLHRVASFRMLRVLLDGATEQRLRAHMDRMNHDPVWKNDQFDLDNDADLAGAILGLAETGLRESEEAAGLEADFFGNLRSAEQMAEKRRRKGLR